MASAAPVSKTGVFRCNGYYRSLTCTNTLYLNNCKHSIKIHWPPLKLPGTTEWARRYRNWCSITWDGHDSIEERKFRPERCEKLMALMTAAMQGFPEVKWQDSACTHIGTPDGVLYTSQTWERPKPQEHFTQAPKIVEPEPAAIRLEDVSACQLHNPKRKPRIAECPVLTQRVQSWLRKFLAALDVHLVMRNPEK